MKIKNKDILIGFEFESMVRTNQNFGDISDLIDSDYTSDGSLSRYDYDHECLEFRSVPMVYKSERYRNYFKQLQKLVDSEVLEVNNTCGFHFHFSIKNMQEVIIRLTDHDFINGYQDSIKANFNQLWELRSGNDYCEPIEPDDLLYQEHITRYKLLNICALSEHSTLENRFFGYQGRHTKPDLREFQRFVNHFISYSRDYLRNIDNRKNIINISNIKEVLKPINYQIEV